LGRRTGIGFIKPGTDQRVLDLNDPFFDPRYIQWFRTGEFEQVEIAGIVGQR
jgi:hypothetical protein